MFEQEDEGNQFTTNQKIIIGIVPWKGRKNMTQVKNIPKQFDLMRIFKYWRKKLKCSGSVVQQESTKNKQEEKDKKYFIQLNGDHRKWIQDFLVYMGICTQENIRMQGKTNM